MEHFNDISMSALVNFWRLKASVLIHYNCMYQSKYDNIQNFCDSQTVLEQHEWWQTFHFWVNYPFNWILFPISKSERKGKKRRVGAVFSFFSLRYMRYLLTTRALHTVFTWNLSLSFFFSLSPPSRSKAKKPHWLRPVCPGTRWGFIYCTVWVCIPIYM